MKTAVARVLVAAGVLCGMSLAMALPAAADCPSPSIDINPSSGRGGDGFVINGHNFFSVCSDSGNQGDTHIEFRFLQGANVYDLGSATAGTPDGSFTGTLYVPTNTTAGSATVQAFGQNGAPSVPFTVTASTTRPTAASSPATTPATVTATPAGGATTTSLVTPPPTEVTNTTSPGVSTPATSTTEVAGAAAGSKGGGLTGAGLALTIALLALVVLGTIVASMATAGRLPLPGRRRRRSAGTDRISDMPAAFPVAAPLPVHDVAESTAPIELVNPFEPEAPADDLEPAPDAGDDAEADAEAGLEDAVAPESDVTADDIPDDSPDDMADDSPDDNPDDVADEIPDGEEPEERA